MTAAKHISELLVPCGACGGIGRPPWARQARYPVVCDICNGAGKLLPVPGMAVTMRLRSSRYPGTIESVDRSGKSVVVRNNEVRKGRFFVPGEVLQTFTRRADGSWRLKGRQTLLLSFGVRHVH